MEKTYTALCTETEASKKRCHKYMRDRCIGQEATIAEVDRQAAAIHR